MREIQIKPNLEYLCPTLILSYIFLHNIYLVLIGNAISLYLINSNSVNRFILYVNNNSINKNKSRDLNNNINEKISNSNHINSIREDPKISLVEVIEELGFIPSIDKNEDNKRYLIS